MEEEKQNQELVVDETKLLFGTAEMGLEAARKKKWKMILFWAIIIMVAIYITIGMAIVITKPGSTLENAREMGEIFEALYYLIVLAIMGVAFVLSPIASVLEGGLLSWAVLVVTGSLITLLVAQWVKKKKKKRAKKESEKIG